MMPGIKKKTSKSISRHRFDRYRMIPNYNYTEIKHYSLLNLECLSPIYKKLFQFVFTTVYFDLNNFEAINTEQRN